jgi:hypothetical protein
LPSENAISADPTGNEGDRALDWALGSSCNEAVPGLDKLRVAIGGAMPVDRVLTCRRSNRPAGESVTLRRSGGKRISAKPTFVRHAGVYVLVTLRTDASMVDGVAASGAEATLLPSTARPRRTRR